LKVTFFPLELLLLKISQAPAATNTTTTPMTIAKRKRLIDSPPSLVDDARACAPANQPAS
jgi:hypothetical protein